MTTTFAACQEEWTELAARDDNVVAELLVLIRRGAPAPTLAIDWTVRQRRSGGVKKEENKKTRQPQQKKQGVESTLTHASPATPLSWSGATSTSGGDGQEESSRPARRPPQDNARSKVSTLTVTPITTTPATRRPKRKKTLAELKDEESMLMRERKKLRHDLAALRLIVEQERARNCIFKQKKLDLQMLHTETITAIAWNAGKPLEISPEAQDNPSLAAQQESPTDNTLSESKSERHEVMLELPDLNVPLEV
ncbi:hypothetical protein SAY86_026208 [Trapa natans]|uniref:Uncharacterized protein n=1 Tax=Trapa natans TaxID=22666 RepID=A0AAN7KAF9_TRANT|nr:hypothetical protein SAY86_026208 [Trapa natans]